MKHFSKDRAAMKVIYTNNFLFKKDQNRQRKLGLEKKKNSQII
jgi:hypothetical protein